MARVPERGPRYRERTDKRRMRLWPRDLLFQSSPRRGKNGSPRRLFSGVDDVSSRSAALVLTTCLAFVYDAPRVAYAAPEPCSLLTQAQVSAALRVSVGAGKPTGSRICRWAAPGGRAGLTPALVLTLQAAQAFEFANKTSTSATLVKTPAAGVGDDAVFNTIGTVTATLTVKKGDTCFEVHVYGFPVDETKSMETTVAKEIVATLK
jgi:hypothetical protein